MTTLLQWKEYLWRFLLIVAIILAGFPLWSSPVSAASQLNLYQPSSTDITSNSVRLSWSKSEDLFYKRYEVNYRQSGGSWSLKTSISDRNITSYTVTGLNPATSYDFKITNVEDWFGSKDSNVVTVTTKSASTCNYTISPSSQSFGASAGSGSVSVTAPGGCSWTAVSNTSWVTITGGSSGSGNGTVNYSVAANTSASSRSGTMTIAGKTFTVTQEWLPNLAEINSSLASVKNLKNVIKGTNNPSPEEIQQLSKAGSGLVTVVETRNASSSDVTKISGGFIYGALCGQLCFDLDLPETGDVEYLAGWILVGTIPGPDIYADARDFLVSLPSGDVGQITVNGVALLPVVVSDIPQIGVHVAKFLARFPEKAGEVAHLVSRLPGGSWMARKLAAWLYPSLSEAARIKFFDSLYSGAFSRLQQQGLRVDVLVKSEFDLSVIDSSITHFRSRLTIKDGLDNRVINGLRADYEGNVVGSARVLDIAYKSYKDSDVVAFSYNFFGDLAGDLNKTDIDILLKRDDLHPAGTFIEVTSGQGLKNLEELKIKIPFLKSLPGNPKVVLEVVDEPDLAVVGYLSGEGFIKQGTVWVREVVP